MSKTVKWILGIVIGLIVVATVVAIGFLVVGRWDYGMMGARSVYRWDGGRALPWGNMHMQPYDGRFIQPFSRFFPLRIIAGWLFCLGILVLIVLGIIALVRALTRSSRSTVTPVQPPEPVPAPAPIQAAEPTPEPTTVQVSTHPCPTCGRQVQDDWNHCPHCGADLSTT